MARLSKKKIVLSGLVVATAVTLVYEWWTGSPPTAPTALVEASGGSYEALTPSQRRLVDDWVARYATATGAAAAPTALYDGLALSKRTTFNAVTNALGQTALTDGAGRPMNLTALDLIAKVDAVAGSIPGQSGDRQFRLYVQVRPDTQQMLEASREFSRQVDNTVYHKGYPTCFRGAGGTPSIQFSLARDGTHGDIDVDYRASAFPIMLINGHLTASNSDVRAGNNDDRHNGRWMGLRNWWRGFMGVAMGESAVPDAGAASTEVATEPRLGKGTKPEEAIFDFLNAWFVERKPGVAIGYAAPRSFACLEVEKGIPVDRGVARFQMARAMASLAERIGSVGRVADAVRGVSLSGPRDREIPQTHRDAFVMYDVREDLAESLDCENRLHPELADAKKAASTTFGDYVGAVFQVKTKDLTGEAVATVWAQDNGRWVLVAYDVEPELRPGTLPSAPASPSAVPESPAPVTTEGDPEMTRAAKAFFEAWFLRRDAAAAFRHLAPSSYACYNVYRPEDAAEARSSEDAGRLIRERITLLAGWAGTGARLDELLVAVPPHHPDLKLVKHADADAFAIVAVPDAIAAAVDCAHLKAGATPKVAGGAPAKYGRFYAASMRLKRAGPEAAVLWTVWARDDRAWRVVSYTVMTP